MLVELNRKAIPAMMWPTMFMLECCTLWADYWLGAKPVVTCQILEFKKKVA